MSTFKTRPTQGATAVMPLWNRVRLQADGWSGRNKYLHIRTQSLCLHGHGPVRQPHKESCNTPNLLGHTELGNAHGRGHYKVGLAACCVVSLKIFSHLHCDFVA